MEVIDELQKQTDLRHSDHRIIKPIKAGNYKLSIQGSSGHYCLPREALPIDCYSEMELAIFNKEGSMITIKRSKLFKKFSRYRELLDRSSGSDSFVVYGYVPMDLINDLYLFLIKHNK